MLDLKLIRENAEMIKANCQRRGFPLDIDGLLALDKDYRALDREVEELRAQVQTLTRKMEEMSRISTGKPAHEEVKTSAETPKTGVKGHDRLARYIDAMK